MVQASASRAAEIAGVVLAGGRSSRMGGGDKALRPFGGATILDRVIARARPQVAGLMLNANGPVERFAAFGLPVRPDPVNGHAGPLAGILAGMIWAAEALPNCPWLASFPCDGPFLPLDLAAQFLAAVERDGADLASARSGGRTHPVYGLWPVRLRGELRHALIDEGVRKVDRWTARYRLVEVEFADHPVDPFLNVNEPADLERAERFLAGRHA